VNRIGYDIPGNLRHAAEHASSVSIVVMIYSGLKALSLLLLGS
jgi:hypothetical protein